MDLAAEQDAASLYTAHAGATDDPLAKKVLLSVAAEERVHAGEFLELLKRIAGDEKHLDDGAGEVADAAKGGTNKMMKATMAKAEEPRFVTIRGKKVPMQERHAGPRESFSMGTERARQIVHHATKGDDSAQGIEGLGKWLEANKERKDDIGEASRIILSDWKLRDKIRAKHKAERESWKQ